MEIPNAIKLCKEIGSFILCESCPIYAVCCADYPTTEDFEKAVEKAATEYFNNKENREDLK